jgi:hypothetical protein
MSRQIGKTEVFLEYATVTLKPPNLPMYWVQRPWTLMQCYVLGDGEKPLSIYVGIDR